MYFTAPNFSVTLALGIRFDLLNSVVSVLFLFLGLFLALGACLFPRSGRLIIPEEVYFPLSETGFPVDPEAVGALKADGAPSGFNCTPGVGFGNLFKALASLTSFLRLSNLSSLKLFGISSVVLFVSVSVPARISSSLVLVKVLSKM